MVIFESVFTIYDWMVFDSPPLPHQGWGVQKIKIILLSIDRKKVKDWFTLSVSMKKKKTDKKS